MVEEFSRARMRSVLKFVREELWNERRTWFGWSIREGPTEFQEEVEFKSVFGLDFSKLGKRTRKIWGVWKDMSKKEEILCAGAAKETPC